MTFTKIKIKDVPNCAFVKISVSTFNQDVSQCKNTLTHLLVVTACMRELVAKTGLDVRVHVGNVTQTY